MVLKLFHISLFQIQIRYCPSIKDQGREENRGLEESGQPSL